MSAYGEAPAYAIAAAGAERRNPSTVALPMQTVKATGIRAEHRAPGYGLCQTARRSNNHKRRQCPGATPRFPPNPPRSHAGVGKGCGRRSPDAQFGVQARARISVNSRGSLRHESPTFWLIYSSP